MESVNSRPRRAHGSRICCEQRPRQLEAAQQWETADAPSPRGALIRLVHCVRLVRRRRVHGFSKAWRSYAWNDLNRNAERMTEEINCVHLEKMLERDFEVYREVPVRHVLFKHRRLRVDIIAVPRCDEMKDIVIGFEVKSGREWDAPFLAKTIKQASDYVLSTIEGEGPSRALAGRHLMAVFIWPAPTPDRSANDGQAFHEGIAYGLMHLGSYFRVGTARMQLMKGGYKLALSIANEVWVQDRGWCAQARHILIGKRQIGSQRYSIVDELKR